MMPTTRRSVLAGTGTIAFAALAGCLGEDSDNEPEAGSEFNQIDTMFLQMMIPHHEQAIEMASLVPDRTDREELTELAADVEDVQQAEIDQMEAWLEEAGVDPDADIDHGEMEGMLSDEEMDELRAAEDLEFDLLFVDGMIAHHEGAIEMAEEPLMGGNSERVAELAEEVIEVQQDEIEMMEGWREEWEGEGE